MQTQKGIYWPVVLIVGQVIDLSVVCVLAHGPVAPEPGSYLRVMEHGVGRRQAAPTVGHWRCGQIHGKGG